MRARRTIHELHVGDTVRCIVNSAQMNSSLKIGMTGVITKVYNNGSSPPIGVRWDLDIGGHDWHGSCDRGHGWFVDESDIEKVEVDDKGIEVPDLSDADFMNLFAGSVELVGDAK